MECVQKYLGSWKKTISCSDNQKNKQVSIDKKEKDKSIRRIQDDENKTKRKSWFGRKQTKIDLNDLGSDKKNSGVSLDYKKQSSNDDDWLKANNTNNKN